MSLRAALVGCGRWGTRLLGAIRRNASFEPFVVADVDDDARARAAAAVPGAQALGSLEAAIAAAPDVVLLATPSPRHADHALAVLEAGIDLFVEKPLAMRGADAHRIGEAARRTGRVVMVGHVLRFHPAVERLVELVRAGDLGELSTVRGRRFTQSGSPDPLWTLGPHDLSTLHALDRSWPERIVASDVGEAGRAEPPRASIALDLELGSGLAARFELSTEADRAERWLVVEGRRGRIVIDELSPTAPLTRQDRPDGPRRPVPTAAAEPLQAELDHLAHCVLSRAEPRTSLTEAAWVVEQLERAQARVRRGAPAERAVSRDAAP